MNENMRLLFLKKEHHFRSDQLAKIGKNELEEVRSIFNTTEDHAYFRKAMNMLVQLDPKQTKKQLFEVLVDDKSSDLKRISVATTLIDFIEPSDEKECLSALATASTPIDAKRRLIQGLGRVGSVNSLSQLDELRNNQDLSKDATFSILLINARNGLKNQFVFDVSPTPLTRKVDREKRSPMKLSKRSINVSENFGMNLDLSAGYEIKCGASLLTFLINKDFDVDDTSRTQLAGLITAEFVEDPKVYSRYVIVFDQNRAGQKQILVFRNDGLLNYGGSVKPDGSFTIECTRKTGSDLAKVQGKIVKGKVQFTAHETATRRLNVRRTSKV